MVGDPSGKTEMRQMMTLETIAGEPAGDRAAGAALPGRGGGSARSSSTTPSGCCRSTTSSSCATSAGTSASTACSRPRRTSCGWRRGSPSSSSTTRSCRPTTSWSCSGATAAPCRSAATTSGATSWRAPTSSGGSSRRRRTRSPSRCSRRRRAPRWARRPPGRSGCRPSGRRVFDFYQYFVNVDDRDVGRFLRLFTFLPLEEIERLAALEGAEHPHGQARRLALRGHQHRARRRGGGDGGSGRRRRRSGGEADAGADVPTHGWRAPRSTPG